MPIAPGGRTLCLAYPDAPFDGSIPVPLPKCTALIWLLVTSLILPGSAEPETGGLWDPQSAAAHYIGAHGADGSKEWIGSVRFFPRTPAWQWWQHIWSDNIVRVSCPFKDFKVYRSETAMGLQTVYRQRKPAFCGFMHLLKPHSNASCMVTLSPFRDAFVAIEAHASWLSDADAQECKFEQHRCISVWRPVFGAAGAALFLYAEPLSHSLTFRLAAGSAVFVLLSAIIIAFYIQRQLPSRRIFMAMSMCLATFPILFKYMISTWMPSALELTGNQVFLGYVAISSLAGLAVTYYFDNPENTKLIVILASALRLLGLTLVYCQCAAPEISGTFAAMLAVCWLLSRLDAWDMVVRVARQLPASTSFCISEIGACIRFVSLQSARPGASYSSDSGATVEYKNGSGAGNQDRQQRSKSVQKQPQLRPRSSSKDIDRTVQHSGSHEQVRYALRPMIGAGNGTNINASPLRQRRHAQTSQEAIVPINPRTNMQRDSLEVSPLVKQGLILNVQTGRTVKIGAGTYNQLTSLGYIEDLVQGTLTPPIQRKR